MKAVVLTRAGSVDGLVLADLPQPSPEPNELLIKVQAATVTRGDVALRKLPSIVSRFSKLARKSVLGHEFAGDVEAAGDQVTRFEAGDRVFGTTTGLASGSHAEFICVPETSVVATLPGAIGYEAAAPVPVGGMAARYFLRPGELASGSEVLVYGASGSVGSFAVQLAAHAGAQVTGVCGATNVELVRSLGAHRVIDYATDDFLQDGRTYDVIFDAVGKAPARRSRRVLSRGGRFASVRSTLMKESTEDLAALRDLLEAGAIRAVIDRRYPLEQVREAHRYVETGHKRGNVVITFGGERSSGRTD